MKINTILGTDFYKIDHINQYPNGTEKIFSNFTPRSTKHFVGSVDYDNKVMNFGLQAVVKDYLIEAWNDNFFNIPLSKIIDDYTKLIKKALGIQKPKVDHIEALHRLGYLRIIIKAREEGTRSPIGEPVLTITNTHPAFFWLVNYLETALSTELWKKYTNATISFEYRRTFERYYELTGANTMGIKFAGHDFSGRGLSNLQDQSITQISHLTSFFGTDTILAILGAEELYGAETEPVIGCSVPATEHSVMCAGGKETELETYRRLITEVYPTGIVSIVSDTWDYWKVINEYLPLLKDYILKREYNGFLPGKTVIRPDCYDDQTKILTPNGWKYFKDLNYNDKVAQVLDDGSYEFVEFTNYVNEKYIGDMYEIYDHHGKVDMKVTPNHRMILNHKENEQVVSAEDFKGKYNYDYNMKITATAKDGSKKLSWFDRLRIAYQADGGNPIDNKSIRLSFSKNRKILRLKNILDNLDIDYKIYKLSSGKTEFNIKVDINEFSKDLHWLDISNLEKNYSQEIIEELSNWDSHIKPSGRIKYSNSNIEAVRKLEIVSISAGYGTYYIVEKNKNKKYKDMHCLYILPHKDFSGGQSWKKKKVKYDGKIYCVTVPTGKLLVKRNRSVLVCGNSGSPLHIIAGYTIKKMTYNDEKTLEENINNFINTTAPYYEAVKFTQTANGVSHDLYFDRNGKELEYHEAVGTVQIMWNIFGGKKNMKNFMELNEHIGLIYGDSITISLQEKILERLMNKGFASNCVILGIGSYSYQYNTRDTLGFAMKATYAKINGEDVNIFKDPKTDDGTKKSAKGMLGIFMDKDGNHVFKQEITITEELSEENLLKIVFENGKLRNECTLSDIRANIDNEFI